MNKYYITTAIPYPNGKPHLGFGFEVIIADVIARYHRLIGDNVHMLAGTDEHGLKVFQSAQKEGLTFQEYVDKNSQEFIDLKEVVNFSYDDFIRTTDQKKHWPGSLKLWEECLKAGKIYKKTYTGLYCVGCEEFKQEKDLVNGECPEHKKAPEKVEEENYFFKLTDFADQIKEKIESGEINIYPESRKNEVLGLLKQGCEDFSVSRPSSRIPWGVPVPNDESQTMYVWFDALANYITAIGYGQNEEEFNKWWPADLHVIGKGISRFHAIFWPAMLLTANLPLYKNLLIHGYVNIGGEKISKSLGNVISPQDVLEKYGETARDPLRYFLLRYITIAEDGNFSYEEFERSYNGELANGLGNLVARVAALAQKNNLTAPEKELSLFSEVEGAINSFKLNEAVNFIWSKISEADKKINEEKPWELEGEKAKEVLTDLVQKIQQIAYNLQPFLPETAEKILNQYKGEIKTSAPLFPRI
jgi:methionyl-tRNA synthetase